MPFSSSLPEWNKTATAPTQTKKDTGWSAGEKPPASIFDWFFNTVYLALKELQQEAINIDQKGVASGIAPLDTASKVPALNLPLSDSISDTSQSKAATANSVRLALDWVKGYGLGTNGKTTTDCNTAILSGFYYVQPGSTNAPSANVGELIVGGGGGYLSQWFTDFSTGAFYLRKQYSSTWGQWKEIAFKEYVDAAPIPINLDLQNGTVMYSDRTPMYTKTGYSVELRGAIIATGAGVTIATLPAGYRPPKTEIFKVAQNWSTSNDGATIYINPDGTVILQVAASYAQSISLAGIRFSTI